MTINRTPSVLIIGAGMTGMLMMIKLREAGISDVRILEKTDRLGGTWRENTYPGVACDVPAHMYTYSFEPNPEWSKRFADGAEIQEYFERVGRKYGVSNSIQFNEAVTSADYNEGQWTVKTSKDNTYVVDFVINCTGILHHTAKPDIKGLDSFKGDMFHTAEWDHSVDYAGKRVGIIGTGSTAAQVIPEVAKTAGKMNVFQRTPQWVLPLGNRDFGEKLKKRWRKNPNRVRRLAKWYEWCFQNLLTKAVTGAPVQNFLFSQLCKSYMRFAVKDPDLRKRLTPNYKVGCKRIIVSSTILPAMQRDNVELIDSGIEEITETGIRTKDGKLHELDVLVLSTGFDPTAYMRPMAMHGRSGQSIDEAWANKIRTYRSITLPDFPNNFLMLGPNTPIGNYSVIAMSEVQTAYVIKLIQRWQQGEFDAIEPSMEAVKGFAEYIKAGMGNTVWVGGCRSWYLDGDGDPILWPYTWQQWLDEMEEPDMSDFVCETFDKEAETKAA
jgi:cation diffusion facilitator CzcD-associated flavoprotein CzcO